MVRKIGNCLMIVVVVALLVIESSTSSPIQNDILEELKVELKTLRVKVDHLEAKNVENEGKILKQEEEIAKLNAKIDAKLISDQPTAALINNDLHPTVNKNMISSFVDSSPRALLPTSCRDLSVLGHSLDGLYLVQNVNTNKVETVLCNFATSVFQQVLGTVDIKTTSAHFYVQRNSPFTTSNAVIPFELARINEGGAFDLASGIFTVPVDGIYHFDFSCVKRDSSNQLAIDLQVNGAPIGRAITTQTATGSFDSLSLTASLRLKRNDEVFLYKLSGDLWDASYSPFTHFTGWLVEEDI